MNKVVSLESTTLFIRIFLADSVICYSILLSFSAHNDSSARMATK